MVKNNKRKNLVLILFEMGIFGAANRSGWGDPLPKICNTYPSIVKLGTVYLA